MAAKSEGTKLAIAGLGGAVISAGLIFLYNKLTGISLPKLNKIHNEAKVHPAVKKVCCVLALTNGRWFKFLALALSGFCS